VTAHARVAAAPANVGRLRGFVTSFAELVDTTRDERTIRESGAALLARLVKQDDWLPSAFAQASYTRYRQYLLHCDSRERFSVVSFVWGPGQSTPIHDHRIWGLVGVLRGAETVERFDRNPKGRLVARDTLTLRPGDVDAFGPAIGDVHRVANAYRSRTSVSIHVYGANIGAVERATFDDDGTPKRFVSGYANTELPNL